MKNLSNNQNSNNQNSNNQNSNNQNSNNQHSTNQDSNDLNNNNPQRKRMPIWMLILTDILLAAVCLGAFSLYELVLPQKLASAELVVATANDSAENTFDLPDSNNTAQGTDQISDIPSSDNSNITDANNPVVTENAYDVTAIPTVAFVKPISNNDNKNIGVNKDSTAINSNSTDASNDSGSNSSTVDSTKDNFNGDSTDNSNTSDSSSRDYVDGDITNYSNTDTDNISSNESDSAAISSKDKVITLVNSYSSNKIKFTTNKIEIGSDDDKITYYLSDIYVTNVRYIKTAFASGSYGKNLTDSALNMAQENNSLLAISGDYYGNSEISVVIRNGVLYRSTGNDADVCVLFIDGTMKTYSPEKFDADELIKKGAWQAWTFGPTLLDGEGKMLHSFNTTDYLYGYHPRSVIGYVKPGHYVFAVIDGRNDGYSRGANLNEVAQIMADAGCVSAYNLDGGKSASMVYGDSYVNQPAQGGRDISDIIYIGE